MIPQHNGRDGRPLCMPSSPAKRRDRQLDLMLASSVLTLCVMLALWWWA